jgi:hypothetical protein
MFTSHPKSSKFIKKKELKRPNLHKMSFSKNCRKHHSVRKNRFAPYRIHRYCGKYSKNVAESSRFCGGNSLQKTCDLFRKKRGIPTSPQTVKNFCR